MERVYVIGYDNGVTKVGVTRNFERRKKELSRLPNMNICDEWKSPFCANAYEVEALIKRRFNAKGEKKEFFNESFDEVCDCAMTIFERTAMNDEVVGNGAIKMNELVDKMFPQLGSKKEQEIEKAVNSNFVYNFTINELKELCEIDLKILENEFGTDSEEYKEIESVKDALSKVIDWLNENGNLHIKY